MPSLPKALRSIPRMPESAADKARRYRERRAGRLPALPVCQACGVTVLRGGALCSRCWERLTPDGRAAKAARVAKSRAKRRIES